MRNNHQKSISAPKEFKVNWLSWYCCHTESKMGACRERPVVTRVKLNEGLSQVKVKGDKRLSKGLAARGGDSHGDVLAQLTKSKKAQARWGGCDMKS